MTDATYEVLAGRYELHRQLATGGSADVFLARDQLLNRPVAVKVLNETLSDDLAFVERLRQEAQLVASLNHQNIVGVFDQGEESGAPFIVMEYVEGRSLADILRSEGKLHPDRAATIAVDVAAALDAAHRQGMVHMDVKPGNVLITGGGQVKLADFGIAKALSGGSETDLTSEGGTVMGTATYLSPEQARGQKVGPRSDVYSLAVVLYEMMTGQPPFNGGSPAEIARKHVDEPPRRPSELGIDIAQSLEAITLKALSKNPAHRYPSVRDFAADLKRYLGGAHSLSGPKGAVAPPVETPRPSTGRSTAPDLDDATVVIPATAPRAPRSQHLDPARPARAQPRSSVAAAPQPQPVPVVVERSEDTWKRNVLFFVALLILLVLLAFLAKAFIDALSTEDDSGDQTDLPEELVTLDNYIRLERDQAISLITSLGLDYQVLTEPNADVESGRVFDQDPEAGKRVEVGSTVVITVSEAEGRVEVPLVVELTREEAVRQLSRLGFVPQITEVDNEDFGVDEVISQIPFAGELADRGSPVKIEVSLGPSERTVPDLAGREFTEAVNEIIDLNFRIVQEEEPHPEIAEGIVLRTEPPAGSLLRGEETLTIFVSTGVAKVLVPPVEGLLADSARQTVVAAGLEPIVEFEPVTNPDDVNRVLQQTPPANFEVEEGTQVRIIVGQEPPPEETTTTTIADTTTTTSDTTTTTVVAQ